MSLRFAPLLAAAILAGGAAPAGAFPFGSATCEANADGSFMPTRAHLAGQDGGFALRFGRAEFYAGETLRVELRHASGGVFKGFLLYAQDAGALRAGLFMPVPGSTLGGPLPAECNAFGHTITHDNATAPDPLRSVLALAWTAPAAPPPALEFRGLVLRAEPMSGVTDAFFELRATLPYAPDGVFRAGFDSLP
jgi:hypothetical protein